MDNLLRWSLLAWSCVPLSAQPPAAEWRSYGGTPANHKYSALSQIAKDNLHQLKIAWRWRSIDEDSKQQAKIRPWLFEVTPLMIGGKLFVSTGMGQVAAIDAATGRTLWTHDPKSYARGKAALYGFTHRGVTYWPGAPGHPARILMGTVDGYLLAIDASTGQPIDSFGNAGRVDLLAEWPTANRDIYTSVSPPALVRGVVIVGSGIADTTGPNASTPTGDVRGYDVRTGKLLWTFHSVPRPGEFGHNTWVNNSASTPRGVSAWTPLSGDEELGYVYLPFSTPSSDYYGGDRLGDNLFGASIVCLEAATGKRVWHYQTTHHDVWDYDPPAAPTLIDITVDGRRIRALAQVSKHANLFVLDRLTGKPVWPVPERSVPQSAAAKERTSATQPIPTKPAPYPFPPNPLPSTARAPPKTT